MQASQDIKQRAGKQRYAELFQGGECVVIVPTMLPDGMPLIEWWKCNANVARKYKITACVMHLC